MAAFLESLARQYVEMTRRADSPERREHLERRAHGLRNKARANKEEDTEPSLCAIPRKTATPTSCMLWWISYYAHVSSQIASSSTWPTVATCATTKSRTRPTGPSSQHCVVRRIRWTSSSATATARRVRSSWCGSSTRWTRSLTGTALCHTYTTRLVRACISTARTPTAAGMVTQTAQRLAGQLGTPTGAPCRVNSRRVSELQS